MIIYVERASLSRYVEDSKKCPTTYCDLTEEQISNMNLGHYESVWHAEVSDLGCFIEGLAKHESEAVIYYRGTMDNHAKVVIYDSYVE